jgi:hypothetical protein
MNGVGEMEVLEFALWTFGVTSFITVAVCVFLSWTMRSQRDRTSVGFFLRWQYVTMGVLSFAKGLLFVYYASRTGGSTEWLTSAWRVVLLLGGSVAALALDVICVMLVAAWFRVNREPLP